MKADHLIFICSRLDAPGGSEKALTQTANLLASKGHKITVLIIDETERLFFPLSPSIQVLSLPLHFGITEKGNLFTRKLAFRKHIQSLKTVLDRLNPGIVIATEYQLAVAARMAGRKADYQTYSWEHHHFMELDKSRFWRYLIHRNYPRLDGVICLNSDEAKLVEAIGARPIIIPNFMERRALSQGENTLITVARLSPVKGIEALLKVALAVLKEHPGWKWNLIGDGELRTAVTTFIAEEKLQGRLVLHPPVTDDISAVYHRSSIYVMTSRNECFPMVLLEAMNHGLPCIAFDCETGPRFIISHEKDGILVEDQNIQSMIRAINSLIVDQEKRKQLGRNAYKNVQRFSPENIYGLWKQFIMN